MRDPCLLRYETAVDGSIEKKALRELDLSGIDWSLLRPRESVDAAEGDVDLLVEPGSLPRVRDVVLAEGFAEMPVPGPDLHAARYDEDEGRFVWLHIQTALRIAGAELPADAVLAEADDRDGLRQPGDSWLLWILLLRALVDKGELPERHRPHVQALAGRWRGGPPLLESLARRHGLEPGELAAEAASGDWEALLGRSVYLPPRPPSLLRRTAGRVAALRALRDPRGLSVAVMGPDGSGKSTLVKGLLHSLPLPVRVQYMGLTGGRRLRVPGVIFAARLLILWSRYSRAAYHRARGGIVVFERYTLDGAAPSGVPLGPAGRLARRLLTRSCPLPDLVLLLDASGETMHERSGEYAPGVLESWRAAYAGLRARIPQLELIDAERPPEAVLRDAEARIWRRYEELRTNRNR
jgi:thymidylate kinase